MKIAITGGSGFVGRHLAKELALASHEVLLLARGVDRRDPEIFQRKGIGFLSVDLTNVAETTEVLRGFDAVVHCAGINREIGSQTYKRVHIDATSALATAAREAKVGRIVMLSFLRARLDCGSKYHESKAEAERIIRSSGIPFTIIKAGMIYGRGDHMLDHLSHSLHTLPLFPTVGIKEKMIAPIPVSELVRILEASVLTDRLVNKTVGVVGAESLLLSEAVRRIAKVLGKRVLVLPSPLWLNYAGAWVFEQCMKIPLVAIAQVKILSESVTELLPDSEPLPEDLKPQLPFSNDQILQGLPEKGGFTSKDIQCKTVAFLKSLRVAH